MDFAKKKFHYGSWKNAFFMDLFKPCMQKTTGEVDYFLDKNDFGLKEDGTPSDVANVNYDGNAMNQIGQIWLKETNLSSGRKQVQIANTQVDETWDCYTHINPDGSYEKYIYRSLYTGCLINNKIRSLSGQMPNVNMPGDNQIAYARANGAGYDIDEYNLRRLINYLLILMSKSLDHQTAFGTGRYSGGTTQSYNQIISGTLDRKGMFYGDNANGDVKVFGFSSLWGNVWLLTHGILQKNGTLYFKMCKGLQDGSQVVDYATTDAEVVTQVEKYINSGVNNPGNISQLYIKETSLVPGIGLVPKSTAGGSSSTGYCDGLWSNAAVLGFARCGCCSVDGLLVGPFCVTLADVLSASRWVYGVALSYHKPL